MSAAVENAGNSRAAPVQNPDVAPNPELLGSLGRLVRGLSLLFWGLPVALVTCWQTAQDDWFHRLGIAPPVLTMALLLHALQLLGRFQKQERVWRTALERTRLFAIINFGLSPFLYWFNQVSHPFFVAMAHVLLVSGLLFLYTLNPVLWRLAAMLPDETLRLETRLFTNINRCLLIITVALSMMWIAFTWLNPHARIALPIPSQLATALVWCALFLFLLPVAMTMALLWKIKEAIFASIFGAT